MINLSQDVDGLSENVALPQVFRVPPESELVPSNLGRQAPSMQ